MSTSPWAIPAEAHYELSCEDFDYFQELIYHLAGISLGPSKQELIKARLRTRLKFHRMESYSEYRSYLEGLGDQAGEWQEFINLLTTNKTDFFREPQHFDYLCRQFLPRWIQGESDELNVWSCASSTGEEPYTLALTLASQLPSDRSYKILASDIDTRVLSSAMNGVYPKARLHEIPTNFHAGNLSTGKGQVADWFRINDCIRRHIQFEQHNLTHPTLPEAEPFDLVFCRNVLIYFSPETIATLSLKLHRSLKPNGLLFIGHSESLQSHGDLWQMIQPSIYRKLG